MNWVSQMDFCYEVADLLSLLTFAQTSLTRSTWDTKVSLNVDDVQHRPGLAKDIEDKMSKCPVCCKLRSQHCEPLLTSDHPWQKVATDLFEWRNSSYVLVVDYYSRYIELAKLSSTSSEVIKHLKSFVSRHGINCHI